MIGKEAIGLRAFVLSADAQGVFDTPDMPNDSHSINIPERSTLFMTGTPQSAVSDMKFVDAGLSSQALWDVLTGVKVLQKREAELSFCRLPLGKWPLLRKTPKSA